MCALLLATLGVVGTTSELGIGIPASVPYAGGTPLQLLVVSLADSRNSAGTLDLWYVRYGNAKLSHETFTFVASPSNVAGALHARLSRQGMDCGMLALSWRVSASGHVDSAHDFIVVSYSGQQHLVRSTTWLAVKDDLRPMERGARLLFGYGSHAYHGSLAFEPDFVPQCLAPHP